MEKAKFAPVSTRPHSLLINNNNLTELSTTTKQKQHKSRTTRLAVMSDSVQKSQSQFRFRRNKIISLEKSSQRKIK